MIIKKQYINENLLIIFPILSAISLLYYANGVIDQLVIIGNIILMLILLILNFRFIKRNTFLVLCLNIASVLTTLLFHSGAGVALVLISLLLAALVFNNISISLYTYINMHFLTAVLLIIYILTVDMKYAYAGFVYDLFGNSLNINTVGFLSLSAFFHIVCYLREMNFKKVYLSIFYILSVIVVIGFINFTGCRTALMAVFLFVILDIVIKNPIKYSHYKSLIVIFLILSIIFPLIYLRLYGQFSEILLLGKNFFSGRQIVWKSVLEQIGQYPIFGSGNDMLIEAVQNSHTQSSHNMLLGIWKMFGIIPTVTMIFFLINKTNKLENVYINKTSQLVFLSSLICAFFESFIMDSHLYMFFMSFLLMNIKVEKREDEV